MGIKLKAIVAALLSYLAFVIYSLVFPQLIHEPLRLNDRLYFGAGKLHDDDPKITPFKINVPDNILQELKRRLEVSRIGHQQLEDVPDFEYGFNLATLTKFRDHWLAKYDWRKYESILNNFPQYTTEIAGLKIHFLHVKPPTNKYKFVIPILVIHGWPGNVFEFYKLIPLLTDPNSSPLFAQNKVDFAFEVIAPSIPGYGWSEQPHKRGFSQVASARIFNTLMTERLGFKKYIAQGGDWGAFNTICLGKLFPEKLHGIHINSAFVPFDSTRDVILPFIGSVWPSLVYSSPESANYSVISNIIEFIKESGYCHLQATKPDTVGVALNDSPIGLLAYIVEKFSGWTNPKFRYELDGGLEKKFTKDELLTIVTIYWVNSNILSSQRYYREHFLDENVKKLAKHYVTVPTGLASFPYDLVDRPPKEMLSWRMNLTHYTEAPIGGHFPAFEVPNELAADIFKFAKSLQLTN